MYRPILKRRQYISIQLGIYCLLLVHIGPVMGQEVDTVQQAFLDSLESLVMEQYRVHRQYDSTIAISERLIHVGKLWGVPLPQIKGNLLIANSSQVIGDFERQMTHAQQARSLAQEWLPPQNPYQQITLSILSNALILRGDYDQAIENYKEVLANSDSLAADGINKIYRSLGVAYTRKGDYLQALRMYHQARALLEEALREEADDPQMRKDLAATVYHLGKCYVYISDEENAMKYLEESKAMYLELGENKFFNQLNSIYQSTIALYYKLKDTDRMEQYLQANRQLQASYPLRFVDHIEVYSGHWHALNEEWEKALPYFENTVQLVKQYGRPNENVAMIHYNLAKTYLQLEKLTEAELHCQTGLQMISDSFPTGDDLPTPAMIMYPTEGISLLAVLGKVWEAKARQDSNTWLSSQKKALACNERVAELAAYIRLSYLAEGSKLALARRLIPIYERGIRVALELYHDQQDDQYLEQAFSFAEYGKAVVLYESLQQSSARQTMVPDSFLRKERLLKRDIAHYQKQIFRAEHRANLASKEKLNRWRQALFEREESLQELLHTLESEFPAYHKAKYQQTISSLADVQSFLKDETQMVLEYFEGDSSIYLFAIDKQQVRPFAIPKDSSILQALESLQEILTDRETLVKEGFSQANIQTFAARAYEVYSHIVQVALKDYEAPIHHLIIIPDGQLYHLPFEALVRQSPDIHVAGFSALPYLISAYNCSYEYSATMLCDLPVSGKKGGKLFGGFAPSYGETGIPDSLPEEFATSRDALAPLLFSQQEVESIQQIVGGEAFVGIQATKEQFKEMAASYQILHLAMHAIGNDDNPNFSSLVFSSHADIPESGLLYTSDIQQMELHADLAVLSACNTGSGNWVRGEGVLSIGRAFRTAGCPNVLMSLWQADDASTSSIMQQFYQGLKAGQTQGEALRAAKLTYIQDHLHAHPHFWAAFVLVGADRPLWHSLPFGWMLFGGLIVLGAGAIWLIRSRKVANRDRSHSQ
ncbi:MAG: CHAT domain-containing tetratricopeptide repeat protein [Bacteroidota bacterium]